METIERNGLTFRVEIEPDDYNPAPWDEEDGHGPVSDWRGNTDKAPGERVLIEDKSSARFYDWQEAIRIAKRDGWGIGAGELAAMERLLGRPATPGEIAEAAVENDFERLRRWCEGDWYYVGVIVTLLDADGNETWESESLWGIESDAPEYIEEVAVDLADEIIARIGEDAHTITREVSLRA